ncbi:N-acetylmuramoyl-L-alanine amidase [Lysinibacillus halotolerans]|uniref:N-acetylmuramoyl-L-alanine amidase n=1 Tax=Lysinibacillus halotolerans TaxID=1368476 RepID=A0A3M8H6C7_9BACI|nr:N-acetylmuramoyl-L-alanine amidase [Lysinibacillus halotolerans]RNC97961.1 N-acetylmuramoyl-L-alanine amidase [Lysinibacillus halotolerans]
MSFFTSKILKSVIGFISMVALIVSSFVIFQSNNERIRAASNSEELQQAFKKAAEEFDVPLEILMAVSYHQSRWNEHEGHSEVGGYGVMNLIDLDLNIDAKGKNEANLQSTADLSKDSLGMAAQLLGIDEKKLKTNTEQNIRGGAALLAQYATETVGKIPVEIGDWYGVVMLFSGSNIKSVAEEFAEGVFTTIETGVERTTVNGQKVTLKGMEIEPNKHTAKNINLRNPESSGADCPNGLECTFIPATYEQYSSSSRDYGNYDLAERPDDGLDIRYIIIHDIEGSSESAINHFQAQSYVSAHYVLDSDDGTITQMVRPKDVAWHAGNWYFNAHSIGFEHEGFAVEGADWYSEQMYRSSAKLVKYLAETYNIPLDRQHIIGHDEVPGLTPARQAAMHWDPGAYWDWSHFFNLLGEPINPSDGDHNSNMITIRPNYHTNKPIFTYGSTILEPKSSSLIPLYTLPSFESPLVKDPLLSNGGTNRINDWGNKAAIGQTYYKLAQQNDWTAIYYGGQVAWFYNPHEKNSIPGNGILITPKEGKESIPVYGAAYPEAAAYEGTGIGEGSRGVTTPLYQLPAGDMYVASGPIASSYYYAKDYNDPTSYKVVIGEDKYYQIYFNHRLGFVKKEDVQIVNLQ